MSPRHWLRYRFAGSGRGLIRRTYVNVEPFHLFRYVETETGFRERQRARAREQVKQGDILLCYLTRLSRWCGVLQVQSEAYDDDSPRFDDPDPFTVRFRVEPIVVLEPELSIPISEENVWTTLSITKLHKRGARGWTGFVRSSLNRFNDADGGFLTELLKEQQGNPRSFPLSERDKLQLAKRTIRTVDREVEVEVPDAEEDDVSIASVASASGIAPDSRESIRMQAQVAQIGAEMGFHIWVPRNDKTRVLEHVPAGMHERFLDVLPLNYDDTTLRTVEQIDVLWLKGRSMSRAFEIEHTTAIYSGLLRMADLLALQPNMNIRLHIVAPDDKRERVLREIRRPVFALLGRGPLNEQCSFLSYDLINSICQTEHLSYMRDTIIAEYEETTEV